MNSLHNYPALPWPRVCGHTSQASFKNSYSGFNSSLPWVKSTRPSRMWLSQLAMGLGLGWVLYSDSESHMTQPGHGWVRVVPDSTKFQNHSLGGLVLSCKIKLGYPHPQKKFNISLSAGLVQMLGLLCILQFQRSCKACTTVAISWFVSLICLLLDFNHLNFA